MLGHLLGGLDYLGNTQVLLLLVAGTAVGVFKGAIPGVGLTTVLSLALAFVYHLSAPAAIALMLGAHAGSYFAASISSILLNTPGAHEAYPVSLDGFPMSRKGQGGRALGLSAVATCLGGIVGCLALTLLIPASQQLPLIFHPPEYVAVVLLAVILTGSLGTDSVLKALISAGLGLMLSSVGSDPVTGEYRFTFGNPVLYGGISLISMTLGLFALPQLVYMFGRNKAVIGEIDLPSFGVMLRSQVWPGVFDALRRWLLIVQSAVIGFVCGIVPGIGGFTANFLALGVAQQTGRGRQLRKEFGTGIPEGVIAPESSSLAKEAGGIIPAIGLGIPSGTGMVIFLAALAIEGLQPGPGFLQQDPTLPYLMMWCLVFGGILGTLLGLVATPILVRITGVRGPLLLPFVVAVGLVGAFAAEGTMVDVTEAVVFAFVGFALRRLNFSMAALGVGLVLGSQFEDQIYLTKQIFGWRFLERPVTVVLLLITVAIIVVQVVAAIRRKEGFGLGSSGFDEADVKRSHIWLDVVVSACLTIVAIAYVTMSFNFSTVAKITPIGAGGVVALCSAIRLVFASQRLYASLKRRGTGTGAEALEAAHAAAGPVPAAPPGPGHPLLARGATLLDATPIAPPQPSSQAEEALTAAAEPAMPQAWAPRTRRRQLAWITTHYPVRRSRAPKEPRTALRELSALAWIVASLISCDLFGFRIGIPVITLVYGIFACGLARWWSRVIFAVCAAAALWGLAYGVLYVLNLSYPGVFATS